MAGIPFSDPNDFSHAHSSAPGGFSQESGHPGSRDSGSHYTGSGPNYADPQWYEVARQYFTNAPEYATWFRFNHTNVDFVIRAYMHVVYDHPAPPNFTKQRPHQSTPPNPGSGSGAPGRPDKPPPGASGARGRDSDSSARRNIFKKDSTAGTPRKTLIGKLFAYIFSWFTDTTGTKEFVEENWNSARETLKPAVSYFGQFKSTAADIWKFLDDHEDTRQIVVTPVELLCKYWKHMLGLFAVACILMYVKDWMYIFPENVYAIKMFWLALQGFFLQGLMKQKAHHVFIASLFTIMIFILAPTDSYHELPDEKLDTARVYKAMDICMKAKTNKFVMEGFMLLEQVLEHCEGNRDGNQCRHLVTVSHEHVHNFNRCIKSAVIDDDQVIEKGAIFVPNYNRNDGMGAYKRVEFQDVVKDHKYRTYAVLIRLETGHYFITNRKLSYYRDQLSQTGEKVLQYWRYLPLAFSGMGPFVTVLDLVINLFGITKGPLTRHQILDMLEYINPSVSDQQRHAIHHLVSRHVSGINDIFYHPHPSKINVKAVQLINEQASEFFVGSQPVPFTQYADMGFTDDYVALTPKCTENSVLRGIIWNMHPKCPLGSFCRAAMDFHVTDHDNSLCPVKCTKTAFGAGCQAQMDELVKTSQELENCTMTVIQASNRIDDLELRVQNDAGFCKSRENTEESGSNAGNSKEHFSHTRTEDKIDKEQRHKKNIKEFQSWVQSRRNAYKRNLHRQEREQDRIVEEPKAPLQDEYERGEEEAKKVLASNDSFFSHFLYIPNLSIMALNKLAMSIVWASLVPTIISVVVCISMCMKRNKKDISMDETRETFSDRVKKLISKTQAGTNSSSSNLADAFQASQGRKLRSKALAEARVLTTRPAISSDNTYRNTPKTADDTMSIDDDFSYVTTAELKTSMETLGFDKNDLIEKRRLKQQAAKIAKGGTVRYATRHSERLAQLRENALGRY